MTTHGAPPYERNSHWLHFFNLIADEIIRTLHPRTVFDAGCAWGFLVEALCDRGVSAYGRDISDYAIGNVRGDLRNRCLVGSVADPITGGPYDLVTCIEVLEHLPAEEARRAIASLTAATDAVLFSSTPDDFVEPTHVNVQPTLYWLRAFGNCGFHPDVVFDASFIAPHAFLVRRRREAVSEDALQLFGQLLRLRSERALYLNRHLRIQELEETKVQLTQSIDRLARELQDLNARFASESLSATAAGQVILRYRAWLLRNRERHAWIRFYWEPFVARVIRTLNKGNPRARAPRPPAAEVPTLAPSPAPAAPAPALEPDEYAAWIRSHEPDAAELVVQRRMGAAFSYRPMISVIVPVYRIPLPILQDALASVEAQTYDRWELCIAVSREDPPETLAYLERRAAEDWRFRLTVLPENEGIAGNSNRALALANGEYVALLDHDDVLAPFALFEVVQLLNETRADFIYSDKDQITEDGGRRLLPLFKPQWSPEIMLGANYLTHLCVMRTEHVLNAGGWRSEMDGAQDWDLFLRVIARSKTIRHLPKVLYHWRQAKTSVAAAGMQGKPYAARAQVRCLEEHARAMGLPSLGVSHTRQGLQLAWPLSPEIRVSVVCVSRAANDQLLERAERLVLMTDHPNFEIVVPHAGTTSGLRNIRVFAAPPGANLRERIEMAVQCATGNTLVFIDDAVSPAGLDWLKELTGVLAIPSVGVVGAKLVDSGSGLLRHAGLVFTTDDRIEALHAGQPEHACEQAGAVDWYRNWSAVSGACFAIRREAWDAVGGLRDEPIAPRLDVSLNLKVLFGTSWRIAYTPFARLLQSAEGALEVADAGVAWDVNAYFPDGDPHFNPNLDCRDGRLFYATPRQGGRGGDGTYTDEASALVAACSATAVPGDRPSRPAPAGRRLGTLLWFLPDFTNPFYGGIHTLFRFADGFRRLHNVQSQFCVLGRAPEARIRALAAMAFPGLASTSRFLSIARMDAADSLPPADAAICSLWVTAYAAEQYTKTAIKFYFVQDDEAMFYPAGSISALVEATYRFGYVGLCNSSSVLHAYTARGGQGTSFTPCVDTAVFHSHSRQRPEMSPYTVFVYGRPGHPRNCFELLGAALRIAKTRMGAALQLLAAGAEWDPRDHGLDGVVHNLGVLGYRSTAALFRICDAGVVMMMTRHPSYVPLELMASGALVITNRNPDTGWLLADRENCLLADLSARDVADRIQEAAESSSLRRRVTACARELVQASYSNWDAEIDATYRYMLSVA